MALNFSIQSDPVIVKKEDGQQPKIHRQPLAGQGQYSTPAAHHGGNLQFQDFPPQPTAQNTYIYDYNQGEQEPQMVIPVSALEAPPNSWLGFSIFSCLCCCWPLGLAAIIYSVRSNDQKSMRNFQKSREHAKTALGLNIAAVLLGTVLLVGVIAFSTWRIVNEAKEDIAGHYGGYDPYGN